MIETRELIYLESIVRNKTLTKAAQELYITQPALTQMVKRLEKKFDIIIFEEKSREYTLTESGKVFYKHVKKFISSLEKMEKEMEDVRKIGSGVLKIGIIESSRYFIPKVIYQFRNKYLKTNIIFKDIYNSHLIESSILNNDIHFAITMHDVSNHNELSYEPIYMEELVLITPVNHRLKNVNRIEVSKLKDEMFIHHQPGNLTGEDLDWMCKKAGFTPNSIYRADLLETACTLVAEGLGITIMPKKYLQFSAKKGIHIVKLINPTPRRTVHFVYNSNRYYPPYFYELRDLIIDFFNEEQSH